jgi:hypothetical protein
MNVEKGIRYPNPHGFCGICRAKAPKDRFEAVKHLRDAHGIDKQGFRSDLILFVEYYKPTNGGAS